MMKVQIVFTNMPLLGLHHAFPINRTAQKLLVLRIVSHVAQHELPISIHADYFT